MNHPLPLLQTPQKISSCAAKCVTRGFTLIEVMIVVVVISIVAAITITGVRQDQFQGAYRRYTDDLLGSVTRARNLAIDRQTLVALAIDKDGVEVSWTDPATQISGEALWRASRSLVQAGILAVHDRACVYGVYVGVQMFEGQVDSAAAAAPTACLSGSETLRFFPDGHVEWDGRALNGAGVTLVVADRRTAEVKESHIQVFPGGLIRKIDNVAAAGY
ncbi:MAG: prepilin-type N-terminal cleavage/methylation domain-containing protein [Nannocystaceae bacterium]